MKTKSAFLAALALLSLSLTSLHAEVTLPAFVDYQGTVFDSTSGAPLGSSGVSPNFTANPTNYTMLFKVFGSEAGTDLIWAETQTVTVSLGVFSVRLGSGAKISALDPAPTVASLADAFNGEDRFLELTVLPTGANSGEPITPRLKFQSTPFAFTAKRAAVADSVTSLAGSRLNGSEENPVTLSGFVRTTDTVFSGGAFGTEEEPASFVGDGTALTSLPDFAALLNADAQTFEGKLGIGAGATSDNDRFEAALNISEGGISLYRESNDNNRPFTREVQAGEIRGRTNNSSNNSSGQLRLTAGSEVGGSFPLNAFSAIDINGGGDADAAMIKFYTGGGEDMRLNYSGNLGINTKTPTEKLDVAGNAKVSGTLAVGGSLTVDGSKVVTGNPEPGGELKIVQGWVRDGDTGINLDSQGAVNWRVVRTGTGKYTLKFGTVFSKAPVVTANAYGDELDNFMVIKSVTKTEAKLECRDNGDSSPFQNSAFMFIAIGER
jgi:hypothetical protein